MRRKLPGDAPPAAGGGHAPSASAPSEADLAQLSAAIAAGEDLGPFVRRAFACGRPEPLLASLRAAVRDREAEIEELCRAHFHDFIRAVDDLRSLLADAERSRAPSRRPTPRSCPRRRRRAQGLPPLSAARLVHDATTPALSYG